jgi:hypothetical protein
MAVPGGLGSPEIGVNGGIRIHENFLHREEPDPSGFAHHKNLYSERAVGWLNHPFQFATINKFGGTERTRTVIVFIDSEVHTPFCHGPSIKFSGWGGLNCPPRLLSAAIFGWTDEI